jgi:hypothetical protein
VLGGFLIFVNLDNASFEGPFAELPVLNQDCIGQLHYVPGSKSGRSQGFSHIYNFFIRIKLCHKLNPTAPNITNAQIYTYNRVDAGERT